MRKTGIYLSLNGRSYVFKMKRILKNISLYNNNKIFFLPFNRYSTIDVPIDISMSNQELDVYLSYKVAHTTNKKVLFFYTKQQNSYLVFISKKTYIEQLIKKYPKIAIAPLSIFYKSLLDDISWAVFNISEDDAFVITNINKSLKKKSLPISLSHIDADDKDIIETIATFINNMMPYIDRLGVIKDIYFDSSIDVVQKLNGQNVYKDINIQKLDTSSFNPKKLAFNFAKIKSFRFYILSSLLFLMIGGFFSANWYLQINNERLIQNIKSHNKKSKSINISMRTIKDIKNQIIIIQKSNDKQISLNSNFSNRALKMLSSQDKIIKKIVLDVNNSYVK